MGMPISRRDALVLGVGGLAGATEPKTDPAARPFLTPAAAFQNVSRGDPLPYNLKGEALARARLTEETWRLEITAEAKVAMKSPRQLADGSALDFKTLIKLGKARGVRYLKAMQCNNIALPLGQGLWEGVLLRDLLALCGPIDNARRLFYWGFHNDKPAQLFRSSLAMGQVLDAPPGELPPFIAYRLNGEAISLERGGPVRMIVPWAHGFKSVKWLQKIVLTNRYDANDTYALRNNDPESYLKTAAYFDNLSGAKLAAGKPFTMRGTAMVGWPGLERVECWLRPAGKGGRLRADDPAWAKAIWKPARIDPAPKDWGGLDTKGVWGFDAEGKPKEWPMRFSVAHWTISLDGLKPGRYELRVRTVDRNGFAQPAPRPGQRSGKNLVQSRTLQVE